MKRLILGVSVIPTQTADSILFAQLRQQRFSND